MKIIINEHKKPTFNHSSLCFGGVISIIIIGVLFFKINIHVLLMLCIVWTCFQTYFLGYKFSAIKQLMSDGISSGLSASYVFILIGVVIAAFMESGTIASLVYYGLDIIHPAIFLPAGLLLCSFMSIAVGTMMGTVGTAGVILIGVGGAMGMPLPIVAGMIIAGASFGDKMSPISDTTNLAAVSAGTNLYDHIKSMAYTTIPTYLICLVFFTIIGLQYSSAVISKVEIDAFRLAINKNFTVSFWGFLPILLMFGLSLKKVPAEPAMVISTVSAVLLAIIQQDRNILIVLESLQSGYSRVTGYEALDLLVNRGGIQSMMNTFSLALFALALGGMLDKAGFLSSLLYGILSKIKSTMSLILATMFTGVLSSLSTGQSYVSIVLTAQLFKNKYDEMNIRKRVLSRTVEESTTLTTPLMPWSMGGAFYAATLGVPVFDYLPWAFLNYLNMFVAIILAFFGIGIFKTNSKSTKKEVNHS